MKQKHKDLIVQLENSKVPLTSQQLGKQLNVTSRSIKNYVNDINKEYPNSIESSSRGYSLLKPIRLNETEHDSTFIPQTYEERTSYIIHRLLMDRENLINLYDLADSLYLSYSSIRQIISKMNKDLKAYNLSIRTHQDMLFIEGHENNKRKYISSIIQKESNGKIIDIKTLEHVFPDIDIRNLNNILHKNFDEKEYYLNDFGYINLVMHIAIILNCTIHDNQAELSISNADKLHSITKNIISDLEKTYHVDFSNRDKRSIDDLIGVNLYMIQIESKQKLKDVVGTDIYNMTIYIIEAINDQYGLNLDIDSLLYPLAQHLKNLSIRNRKKITLKNPLLETIQKSCPILFDCAVYIANILKQKYNMDISNDEIAYIAMHIGSNIEKQNKENKKLKCALICPDYQNNRLKLYNFLLIHFGNFIYFSDAVPYESELTKEKFDLVFSTISLQNTYPSIIYIPPMKNAIDIQKVFSQIQDCLDNKKIKILQEKFDVFFNERLFLSFDHQTDHIQVIDDLASLLEKNKYVGQAFKYDVHEREKAATTAFGNVAIPHSMHMNAMHTGISIGLSEKGIVWNDNLVHVVLLIAINEKESHLFKEIYEALILLFSSTTIIDELRFCQTFENFKTIIFKHIN